MAYEPAEGDWVQVGGGEQIGQIEQINGKRRRAKLSVGNLNMDVALNDLRPAQQPELPDSRSSYNRYTAGVSVQSVSPEIDLHGMRVEAARDRVDKYLDEAILAHLAHVRVIHGLGTGALRKALHEFFGRHPHVKSFRLAGLREGGPAVTLVNLG